MNTVGAIVFLIALAAVVAAIVVFNRRKKQAKKRENVDVYFDFDIPEPPPHEYRTASGVRVRSCQPVQNQRDVFAAVDRGAETFLRSTASKGWTRFRLPTELEVWLLPPVDESSEGYPALRTRSGQKIAGIAIGVNGYVLDQPFVCVPYTETFLDWLTNCCRAEWEHVGDMNSAEAMAEHSQPGHQHFFYNETVGFYAAPLRFRCGVENFDKK